MKLSYLAAFSFALTLAGCGTIEVASSNSRSVTVKAGEVRFSEAQRAADAECGKYNRHARLKIRSTPDTANYWVYDCIE